MNTIRILISDDHAMVREGLRGWIEREQDFTIVAEAGTTSETISLCAYHEPDVLLQDLQMPEQDGLDVIRTLRQKASKTRILAFSGVGKHYASAALEAGADGFLSKEERKGVVLEAIRWAATKSSGTWVSPLATNAVQNVEREIQKYHLTITELAILKLLKESNKEIAAKTFVSEGTVRNHISMIYSKLGLRTRQQAIQWAEQHGFILGPPPTLDT
jgi:two-component system, NarL family, response regulator DesR